MLKSNPNSLPNTSHEGPAGRTLRLGRAAFRCLPHQVRRKLYPTIPRLISGGGIYEPATTSLVRKLLRPGMTVVDVGANFGHYTVLGARLVGKSGHVYSFEPDSASLMALQRNIETYGCTDTVTIVTSAVGSGKGNIPFFSDGGKGRSSILRANATTGKGAGAGEAIVVETTSLDEYFGARGWPPVDLVLMDIEGAERLAIDGMKELVLRNRGFKLIIEFCREIQDEAGVSVEEFFGLLHGLGFNRFKVILGDWFDPTSYGFRPGPHELGIPHGLPMLKTLTRGGTVNVLCEKI